MEYVGEIVGSKVGDKREREYDRRGIGTYLFRLGEDEVVDATMCGNLARFVNHSCEVRKDRRRGRE